MFYIQKFILLLSFFTISVEISGQTQHDIIIGKVDYEKFGSSVSFSEHGDILAVGAPHNSDIAESTGQVRIFESISGEWVQKGDAINGQKKNETFGKKISLSSDGMFIAIEGATEKAPNGKNLIRIYHWDKNQWIQVGNTLFGDEVLYWYEPLSLSSNGRYLIIGSPLNDKNGKDAGQVTVYKQTNEGWEVVGSPILGENSESELGSSVSISDDGQRIAVAPRNNSGTTISNKIRIYENISDEWVQIGEDIKGGKSTNVSLSADGLTIAVGYTLSDTIETSTKVRVFKMINNSWKQIGNSIDSLGLNISLSSDGTKLAVSDPNYRYYFSGRTTVFELKDNKWTPIKITHGSTKNNGLGTAISIAGDGSRVVSGAPSYICIYSDPPSYAGYVEINELTLNTNQKSSINTISISPNPTSGILKIKGLIPLEIVVINALGEIVIQTHTPSKYVDISNLPNGTYFMMIKTKKDKISKIIIKI